jgi:hypothetical protein
MFALHSRGVSLLLAGSLFAISIPSSAGYPTNITERGINTVNGLYVCDGVNFAGFCEWHEIDPNAAERGNCLKISHKGGIVSVGPDYGLQMKLYSGHDCDEKNVRTAGLVCPGWPDMTRFGRVPDWEDMWVRVTNVDTAFIPATCPSKYTCKRANCGAT